MLVLARALQGATQGLALPSMFTLMANWLPLPEKARLMALIMSGAHLAVVTIFPASSQLAHAVGWEYIFYVFAAPSILWFVFWCFLVYESPEDHPRISKESWSVTLS